MRNPGIFLSNIEGSSVCLNKGAQLAQVQVIQSSLMLPGRQMAYFVGVTDREFCPEEFSSWWIDLAGESCQAVIDDVTGDDLGEFTIFFRSYAPRAFRSE